MMEVNGSTSCYSEKKSSENSTPSDDQERTDNNSTNTSGFVNHAAIVWDENRRKWIGDLSRRSRRIPKDPIISWSMTYEDLLSTNDPFPRPIPLPEMVDFLVDIWLDEGLFD